MRIVSHQFLQVIRDGWTPNLLSTSPGSSTRTGRPPTPPPTWTPSTSHHFAKQLRIKSFGPRCFCKTWEATWAMFRPTTASAIVSPIGRAKTRGEEADGARGIRSDPNLRTSSPFVTGHDWSTGSLVLSLGACGVVEVRKRKNMHGPNSSKNQLSRHRTGRVSRNACPPSAFAAVLVLLLWMSVSGLTRPPHLRRTETQFAAPRGCRSQHRAEEDRHDPPEGW